MRNAAKDQRHHQIGQGCQRYQVDGDPALPLYLLRASENRFGFQAAASPLLQSNLGLKTRGSRNLVTEHALSSACSRVEASIHRSRAHRCRRQVTACPGSAKNDTIVAGTNRLGPILDQSLPGDGRLHRSKNHRSRRRRHKAAPRNDRRRWKSSCFRGGAA